jgi:hypothetical protein
MSHLMRPTLPVPLTLTFEFYHNVCVGLLQKAQEDIERHLKTAEMLALKGDTHGQRDQIVGELLKVHTRFQARITEYQVLLNMTLKFYGNLEQVSARRRVSCVCEGTCLWGPTCFAEVLSFATRIGICLKEVVHLQNRSMKQCPTELAFNQSTMNKSTILSSINRTNC